jgi:hypothetical protein
MMMMTVRWVEIDLVLALRKSMFRWISCRLGLKLGGTISGSCGRRRRRYLNNLETGAIMRGGTVRDVRPTSRGNENVLLRVVRA